VDYFLEVSAFLLGLLVVSTFLSFVWSFFLANFIGALAGVAGAFAGSAAKAVIVKATITIAISFFILVPLKNNTSIYLTP
jgi:uncharacterized membrane protein